MTTERVNYLKNALSEKTPDVDKITEILELDYKNNESEEIFRKSAYLKAFSEKMPIVIDENELICGSMHFWKGKTEIRNLNKGHIIVDYRMILKLGLPGIKEKLLMLKTKDSVAFSESVDALCHFILRYANEAKSKRMYAVSKNCLNILNKKLYKILNNKSDVRAEKKELKKEYNKLKRRYLNLCGLREEKLGAIAFLPTATFINKTRKHYK